MSVVAIEATKASLVKNFITQFYYIWRSQEIQKL